MDILDVELGGSLEYSSEPIVIDAVEDSVTVVEDSVFEETTKETIEETTEETIEETTEDYVSVIDSFYNEEIITLLKDINENVQKNTSVSSNDIGNSVDDTIISVSQNEIMTKNLNDYTVSESLSLMIFLSILCTGLVFIIRKGLYKWT